jgi:uncharacterized protein (DUF1778 family)
MNSKLALETQISAVVSPATRILLEKHARATGVKKSHLIEQALLHHLQALDALPAEVIVNPLLVVSRKSGQEILKRITRPQRPTKQLRALMRNGN